MGITHAQHVARSGVYNALQRVSLQHERHRRTQERIDQRQRQRMQLQLWYRVLFLLLQCRSFMIILNYAHPLTDAILDQITATVGAAPEVRMIDTQTDRLRPMADVEAEL